MTEREMLIDEVELRRIADVAKEVHCLFGDNGLSQSDGMDCVALVVTSMLIVIGVSRSEAHDMADSLATCIKTNFDLRKNVN